MKNLTLPALGAMTAMLMFCSLTLSAQTDRDDVTLITTRSIKKDNGETGSFARHRGYEMPHDPCKVFIGVGTTSVETGGLKVDYIVDNTVAVESGLKAGDIILAIDNVPVASQEQLINQRDKHQAGDAFTMTIQRDGSKMTINARFKACTEAEKEQAQAWKEARKMHSFDNSSCYTRTFRRDPCAVFIGVYTGSEGVNGKGIQVTEVIDDTPAKSGGVQAGDIIVALDRQDVNSYDALCRERDKHKPGDAFRLTVLRNGKRVNLDTRFKSCGQTKQEQVESREQPGVGPESTLVIESLDLYPNPTTGPVNLRFEAEAVPTTVRILDAAGKTVYRNVLNQFSGSFKEEINLGDQKPGVFTLSIQQGEKTFIRKIVLVTRA